MSETISYILFFIIVVGILMALVAAYRKIICDKKPETHQYLQNCSLEAFGKMKQCKYCKMWIDEEATICPHCRKRQPMSAGKAILWTIFTIILVLIWYGNYSTEYEKNLETNTVTMENFDRIKTGMSYEEVCDIFGKEGTSASAFTVTVGIGDTSIANAIEYKKWSTKYINGSVIVAFDEGKVLTKIANNLE